MIRPPPISTLFPYTTLFRSHVRTSSAHASQNVVPSVVNLLLGEGQVTPLRPGFALSKQSGPNQFRQNCIASIIDTLVRSQRSEEHTSELQSLTNLVCRLLLENDTATSDIYTLSLHDALPISRANFQRPCEPECRSQCR